MSESIDNWRAAYDIKVQQDTARERLGGKTFAGPFSRYDCWSLVNFKFLADSLVYRLCLLANLMRAKGEEKEIDVKMWVEDPIAFAQCVSLTDLTNCEHESYQRSFGHYEEGRTYDVGGDDGHQEDNLYPHQLSCARSLGCR